jgi:hypothetical protein
MERQFAQLQCQNEGTVLCFVVRQHEGKAMCTTPVSKNEGTVMCVIVRQHDGKAMCKISVSK